MFFALFSAIGGDGGAYEGGGAGSLFIDIVLEALVGDVHFTEAGEDLAGAGVIVLGNIILQFFHQRLRLV